jgi:cytochrome P450
MIMNGQSHRNESPRKTSPTIRGYPLLGVIPQLLIDSPQQLTQIARQYPGEICSFYLGPIRIYLVTSPEHVQRVLADNARNFVKGSMWIPMRRLLGNGLLASDGDEWLNHRRLMQPLFASKYISTLAVHMSEVVADAMPRLESIAASGASVDMCNEMLRLSQGILLRTMFSTSLESRKAKDLGAAVITSFRELNVRLFLYFLPKWLPLPGERALHKAIQTIDKVMYRMVRERRQSSTLPNDLLSLLLNGRDDETGKGMDDRQVRDELVTLVVAGTDTTALAMTWLWYVLDQYPEVDRKLRQEVDVVLQGRIPTFDDLASLPYTKMVLMETMRLYPPGWFVPRFTVADDVIDGYPIPAGSTILLCPYATHRDPAVWERPDVFDPERFSPERSAGRPRYAYLPFGGGPRQCIGMQFALIEAQIITAMLVQRFRPRCVPGVPVVPHSATTLKPRHGLPVTLTRV